MDKMTRFIVPITDCYDVAYAEMRAALIKAAGPEIISLIEPVVAVKPLSLVNANFVIRLLAEAYSECGAILYTVVNPSQDQPERVIGRTRRGNLLFAGRNNGAFSWLVEDFGCEELVSLPDPGYIPFGGKMIYPPFVARAASGASITDLGTLLSPQAVRRCAIEDGTIVHIDNFGIAKLKLYLSLEEALGVRKGDFVTLRVNGRRLGRALYSDRLMSAPDNTWVIYAGSSLGGLAEIGVARDSAAALGCLHVGDKIEIGL